MRQRTAEILGLLLLMSYAIAGADLVPFHGDEATLLHVGQDPTGSADSEDAAGASSTSTARRLVLVNGTVPTFAVMLSWKAAGYSAADLNDPWIWGRGLTWNRDAGRMPSQGLLAAARRPAVWFTAASIPLIFAVARRWAGLGAASITCLLFATHATVLLHGRRAMMEGAFLFFGLATVLVAIVWAGRGVADAKRTGWPDASLAVALAAASGFAVASKHSALATVAGVYAALIAVSLRPSVPNRKRRLGWVAASGVGSILVFLALNPAWWDAPLARPLEILELRRQIVVRQTTVFADRAFNDVGDRAAALLARLAADEPEYSEFPGWSQAIDSNVRAYRDSLGSGIRYGGGGVSTILGLALLGATAFGAVTLVRGAWAGDSHAWVIAAWAASTAGFILIAIPLDWQRYYVPLYPIQVVLAGAGASRCIAIAQHRFRGGRQSG